MQNPSSYATGQIPHPSTKWLMLRTLHTVVKLSAVPDSDVSSLALSWAVRSQSERCPRTVLHPDSVHSKTERCHGQRCVKLNFFFGGGAVLSQAER